MKAGLRRQLFRATFALTTGFLLLQVVLFAFVDLTDLHWPPGDWLWVIRGSLRTWMADPELLEHELKEFLSLGVIALLAIPVVWFSVHRMSARIFGPLERIAAEAERISAGGGAGRLSADEAHPGNEINAVVRACNLAFDRYEETFQRLDRFTRDASHQLRTPLATIRALGEVCLGAPRAGEEYREAIGRMLEESSRLLAVVETLLETARRDPRETRARFRRLDAARLLREVGANFAEHAELRAVRLRTECAGEVPVLGDEALLEQALSNLVDNALHHAPEGGEVVLCARAAGGRAELEVRDDGPGVDAETRARLFQPFARAKDAPYHGTGLGLAIVADVARLHGGEASLDPAPAPGARFRLSLPAAP